MNIQAAFLVLTLVLAGWLGYQAVDAASSHRRAAEAALIDYAGIAAWEFSRTGEDDLDDVLNDVFNPVKRRMRGGDQPVLEVVRWNLHDAVRDEGCPCPGWREPVAVFGYDAVRDRTYSVPADIREADLRRLADTIFAEWPFSPRSDRPMT